jgi:hypothetical protein
MLMSVTNADETDGMPGDFDGRTHEKLWKPVRENKTVNTAP